jgi:pyruvate/2-oxoglutarate dehydrogenase complex dihydrolipoamide acyltransferase (E2) component
MLTVRVDENLWNNSTMPEGELMRWRVSEGAHVEAGQPLAEVRIEDALHEIPSPASGILVRQAHTGEMIQPGSPLGWVSPRARP